MEGGLLLWQFERGGHATRRPQLGFKPGQRGPERVVVIGTAISQPHLHFSQFLEQLRAVFADRLKIGQTRRQRLRDPREVRGGLFHALGRASSWASTRGMDQRFWIARARRAVITLGGKFGHRLPFTVQETNYDSHFRAAGLPGADHQSELRRCLCPCRVSSPWSLREPAGSGGTGIVWPIMRQSPGTRQIARPMPRVCPAPKWSRAPHKMSSITPIICSRARRRRRLLSWASRKIP
ncbi:MAG: hypothetical protein DLM68_06285, partial [Hyphomicrobiales bacterium]